MSTTTAPVTIRPRLTRVGAWVASAVLLAGFTWIGVTMSATGAGGGEVQLLDRVATVGMGAFMAAAVLVVARPRVTADADGIRVRNLVGGYEFAWSAVRHVRFDRDSWWASLELSDGDEVAVLAVQVVDRERAVAAVRALRQLHAAHAGSPGTADRSGGEDPPRRAQRTG